jgi:hypothetical protein
VNSGNRTFIISVVAFLGAFAAADAGRLGESSTGAMWVAPELLEALDKARFPDCTHDVVIKADLQTNGRVVFEWHPDTGELSFATPGEKSAAKLPEWSSSEPLAATTLGCGSR